MTTPQRITTTRAFSLVQDIVGAFPDRFNAGLLAELRAVQPDIEARMKAGVPSRKSGPPSRADKWRKPGGLKSLLSSKLDTDERRLSFGLLTPQARADGFYGYILDAGRGLTRSVSRKRTRYLGSAPSLVRGFETLKRQRFSKAYSRKISPIAPGTYDITFGRVRAYAQSLGGPMLLRAYDKVLGALLRENAR